MAPANLNAFLPYPVRNPRFYNSPIIGTPPGSTQPVSASPDFVLAGTPVSTPPVPQSQIVGYSAAQAAQSVAVPVTALGAPTQTLAGTSATFSLATVGMFPLLILALVLYLIFKG
jgi:hypothetical protein